MERFGIQRRSYQAKNIRRFQIDQTQSETDSSRTYHQLRCQWSWQFRLDQGYHISGLGRFQRGPSIFASHNQTHRDHQILIG